MATLAVSSVIVFAGPIVGGIVGPRTLERMDRRALGAPYENPMTDGRLPDRSLTGIGAMLHCEPNLGSFAMSDILVLGGALALFGLAALYARLCGDL